MLRPASGAHVRKLCARCAGPRRRERADATRPACGGTRERNPEPAVPQRLAAGGRGRGLPDRSGLADEQDRRAERSDGATGQRTRPHDARSAQAVQERFEPGTAGRVAAAADTAEDTLQRAPREIHRRGGERPPVHQGVAGGKDSRTARQQSGGLAFERFARGSDPAGVAARRAGSALRAGARRRNAAAGRGRMRGRRWRGPRSSPARANRALPATATGLPGAAAGGCGPKTFPGPAAWRRARPGRSPRRGGGAPSPPDRPGGARSRDGERRLPRTIRRAAGTAPPAPPPGPRFSAWRPPS